MKKRNYVTNSAMACLRACPRRFLLRYEYMLRRAIDDTKLRVGRLFARGIELITLGQDINEGILRGDETASEYELAMASAMLACWQEDKKNDTVDEILVDAEVEFETRLENAGRRVPGWRLAGKVDQLVFRDGKLLLKEYKTTSRDFSAGSVYWEALQHNSQISLYLLGLRRNGFDVRGVLYDVTRRPNLRPLKATPPEARKYTKEGKLYQNQREADETPSEFAARCAADLSNSFSFCRMEVARTDDELAQAEADLVEQLALLRRFRKTGRWYRNTDMCSSCDYLPICNRQDLATTTPLGFRRAAQEHEEIENDVNGAA